MRVINECIAEITSHLLANPGGKPNLLTMPVAETLLKVALDFYNRSLFSSIFKLVDLISGKTSESSIVQRYSALFLSTKVGSKKSTLINPIC